MKFCIALLFFTVALANAKQWKTLRPLVDPLTPPPPKPSERIVGGCETTPHAYPHQVALYIGGMYFCGGSLIAADVVLTAAHCMDGQKFVEVVAGAHNLEENEASQKRQVSYNFVVHEDYDNFRITNDVAVIFLSTKFEINDNVRPVCYNGDKALPDVGTVVTPTGWGRTSDSSGGISDVLMQVDVPVMSNEDCNAVYGNINGGHICIDSTGGKGTCNGDSGGPLNYEGRTYGITSFGASAGCEAGYPDAFTRTSYYADWITEHAEVPPC